MSGAKFSANIQGRCIARMYRGKIHKFNANKKIRERKSLLATIMITPINQL